MDGFDYEEMVQEGLRGVVRDALEVAALEGLPGAHHFYIAFKTDYPHVQLPDYLRDRHPEEMTIVVQHQYWGLEVSDDWFEVTLSFNRINERLHIPFAAVSAFADPFAKFGIQIPTDASRERPASQAIADADSAQAAESAPVAPTVPAEGGDASDRVVTLDKFRKK